MPSRAEGPEERTSPSPASNVSFKHCYFKLMDSLSARLLPVACGCDDSPQTSTHISVHVLILME